MGLILAAWTGPSFADETKTSPEPAGHAERSVPVQAESTDSLQRTSTPGTDPKPRQRLNNEELGLGCAAGSG
jgi:hypothetical protein